MAEPRESQERLIRGAQQQGTAAWINQLNQARIDGLLRSLKNQDVHLGDALASVDDAIALVREQIVERNRGGLKGMHGFIAEVAEVGVGNARSQITGGGVVSEWVNNNGAADLVRDGVEIQQKFVASGGRFGLNAVADHLAKYPDFLSGGGRYQVARDQFEAITQLHGMPEEQARKSLTNAGDGPSLKDWEYVQRFFAQSDVSIQDLEPSLHHYNEVQRGVFEQTLSAEKESLRETDEALRKAAYEKSLPSWGEAAQATVIGAGVEGATEFVMAVMRKRREGKQLRAFNGEDWADVAADGGRGALRGGVRGLSIYGLTNFTATSAAVASSLVTASFGIAEQAHRLRTGDISEVEFLENAEQVALESAVSALSSMVGQAVIPIPVVGAIVGNTVGMVMYRVATSGLSAYEANLIEGYRAEQHALDERLALEHRELLEALDARMSDYLDLLDRAFAPDVEAAFAGSIELALALGVGEGDVLDTPEKVTDFFTL